jgi:uncharacterized protein
MSAVVQLLFACCIAAAFGWWLLWPRRIERAHMLVQLTPAPSPTLNRSASGTPAMLEPPAGASSSPSAAPTLLPLPERSGGARLALIVDDCGQWIDTERGFLALDIPITMSVLPDVRYTETIAREASAAGKGVMLHLPMETVSGLDPGPGKVTTEMTDAAIEAQVEADLAQIPSVSGVNNHEGSKGSADERVMRDVVAVLAKHGNLFFVDSLTSPQSVGGRVAQAAGIPTADRDVFLDNQARVAYTEGQLREAASIARRTGSAIAIGHPRPTTLAAVRAMIPELQAEGIEFVLAGDLAAVPAER